MLDLTNSIPPAVDSSWSVGRKEPVLALHQDLWHRGVAVLKKGQEFALFLVDIGQTVTVKLENIRPLLAEFQQIPPFAFQVLYVSRVSLHLPSI